MKLPKWIKLTLGVFSVIGVLVAGNLISQWFYIDSNIEVSSQTTFITAPLHSNGLPNYAQAFVDRCNSELKSENDSDDLRLTAFINAMWPELPGESAGVPLWQKVATEPGPEMDFDILALQAGRGAALNTAELTRYAWTREDAPKAAEWIEAHAAEYNSLTQASSAGRSFLPKNVTAANEFHANRSRLQTAFASAVANLCARAMLHLGNTDSVQAWQDCKAALQVVNCIPSYTTADIALQCQLKGNILDCIVLIACKNTSTVQTLQEIEQELNQLKIDDRLSRLFNEHIRFAILESAIESLQSPHAPANRRSMVLKLQKLKDRTDANLVLAELNDILDDLVKKSRIVPGIDRSESIREILTAIRVKANSKLSNVESAYSVQNRSRQVAYILALPLSSIESLIVAADTTRIRAQVLQVTCAVHRFKQETGEYPAHLTDLVPTYLNSHPSDVYTHSPLRYRVSRSGCMVYSSGLDAKDNGGNCHVPDATERDEIARWQPTIFSFALENFNALEFSETRPRPSKKVNPSIPLPADDIALVLPLPKSLANF